MEHKRAVIGDIDVFDAGGYPVEPPIILDLETTYIFKIPITNQTKTQGGQSWEALLETGLGISLDGVEVVPFTIVAMKFAPNLTIEYVPEIYILEKYAGLTGRVRVEVYDPFGESLDRRDFIFRVGDEVSPYIKYSISGSVLVTSRTDGLILPTLNPDEITEGVVMGTEAAVRQPPPPPPPPKKIDYSKSTPPPGIDYSPIPEPDAGWEGETVSSSGRIA